MKIGLIARSDNTGLGNQTYEFYRHMSPHKTMVVDISQYNGNKQHPDRYPNADFVYGIPNESDIIKFLDGLDVVFVAEAPYNYALYDIARQMGVKTVVQYNYEFFDWFSNPYYPKPDMLIAPSRWNYSVIEDWCIANNVKHIYLHCPVDTDKIPFKERRHARKFLHTAGKSAAHDRNGTLSVIEAAKYIRTDAQIIIHFQGEQGLGHQLTTTLDQYRSAVKTDNITINQHEYENYEEIYEQGDVLLLPRRYGGNCLPLNEALSSGMPAIMTDITPNKGFLPDEWLVPANLKSTFVPRTTVSIYEADPIELAHKIDEAYLMSGAGNSRKARSIAESVSWETMRPQYLREFEKLCNGI